MISDLNSWKRKRHSNFLTILLHIKFFISKNNYLKIRGDDSGVSPDRFFQK